MVFLLRNVALAPASDMEWVSNSVGISVFSMLGIASEKIYQTCPDLLSGTAR